MTAPGWPMYSRRSFEQPADTLWTRGRRGWGNHQRQIRALPSTAAPFSLLLRPLQADGRAPTRPPTGPTFERPLGNIRFEKQRVSSVIHKKAASPRLKPCHFNNFTVILTPVRLRLDWTWILILAVLTVACLTEKMGPTPRTFAKSAAKRKLKPY